MIPEPSSDARPMSVSSFTTLGTTLAATCSTDPAGRLAAGTLGAAVIDVPPAVRLSGFASSATPPPMPADTTAIASAPAVKAPARERFGARCGAGGAAGCGCWRRAAVRVVGLPVGGLLLLSRVAPVVGLLLVAGALRGRC